MQDIKVGADDARRAGRHEAVKAQVERDVNADIAGHAATVTPAGEARVAAVAGQMHDRAVDEAARAERTMGQARSAARGSQFMDYGFYVLYSLLVIRLVLALIAAQAGNGFVQFINAVSGPFYAPFRGIVPSATAEGGYTLVVPILVAIGAYMALHAALNGALRMVGRRKTEV